MAFFHGIAVQEVLAGGVSISVVPAALVGIVGTAPTWAVLPSAGYQPPPKNTPTLIGSTAQGSQFGPMIQGYSIPYALNQMQLQSGQNGSSIGQAIIVNVFDPSLHNTAVVSQSLTFPASGLQYLNTGHMGIVGPGLTGYSGATTLVVKSSNGSITYTENTDYTVDYRNGFVYAKAGGSITTGEAMALSYSYCDPSQIQQTDLVGTVSGGSYTGMQSLLLCQQLFGVTPRILIAPSYGSGTMYGSKNPVVASGLVALANTLKGFCVLDSLPNVSVATALANRSVPGAVFATNSYRAVLTFPELQFTDTGIVPTGTSINAAGAIVNTIANSVTDGGYSAWYAGAWSSKIVSSGYWFSPSNTIINGPIGPDVSMYMSFTDPNSDDNVLNAAGITTVMQAFGTGLRVWGNRSSAFPTYTDITTFVAVRMVMDVVETSIQQSSLQFVDQPITTGWINNVLTSVNGFIRDQVRIGALVPGSAVSYNPGDNPALNLAAGQVVFEVNLCAPPPAEDITYNFTVNVALLSNTGPAQQAAATFNSAT